MIDAFEMDYYFQRSFLNRNDGQIVSLTDEEDLSDVDEEVEDDFIPEHYLPLPEKDEINEYSIMEKFCCSIDDEKIKDKLLYAIQGKGAFGRFRTLIHNYEIEEHWYRFKHARLKEIAIEFCEFHNIPYYYTPRGSSTPDLV